MASETYRYIPCEEADWMLLQWLSRMKYDGELDKTLSKGTQSPSAFLAFFNPVLRQLFFQIDDFGNIKRACWVEMTMGSVFLSYYAAPGHRRHRDTPFFIFDCFDMVFQAGIPVICGLIQERPTQKETMNFIRLHEKMGYEYCGWIPKFFDGCTCHLVALTKESWENLGGPKKHWEKARKATGG